MHQRLKVSTLKQHNANVEIKKCAIVCFESDVHRDLRRKAAALDLTISDMVNVAVKAALAEDAEDLATFSERKNEKSVSFDSFVQGLKKRGRM